MEALAPYWKAVIGFIAPAATVLIASVTEVSDGGSAITGSEWVTAACTAVVTAAGVYAVRNAPARGKAVDGRHEAGI